ncbi:hypothetical protein ACLOJK_019768 [Asimina triloba]
MAAAAVALPLSSSGGRISNDSSSYRTRFGFPSPSLSAICKPSARFDLPRSSLRCRQRLQYEGGTGSLQIHKNITWKKCVPLVDRSIPCPVSSLVRQHRRMSCLQNHGRRKQCLERLEPRVLLDKSTFPLEKHARSRNSVDLDVILNSSAVGKGNKLITYKSWNTIEVKPLYIPQATVGPDEPHVASTAWPDTALEKRGLGLWDGETEKADLEAFLNSELPSHPNLYRGQLKNGLRYLILPNKVPANRFEAHMEVHVGSIDEEDDEQGIAHMIEHVAFLGSKKREKLLGTGARSNAYTDFHHTVFHIHSPTRTKVLEFMAKSTKGPFVCNAKKDSDGDLLPFVLDALNEIAFHPKFLASRVEKERRAILSELQMMNTIEYRVDCQASGKILMLFLLSLILLQHLHSENKLSKRFPIGLEEQIKKWDADKIRRFHERWYFPANATLYIVGDIDNISKTIYQIEAVFGQTHAESDTTAVQTPRPFGGMASFLVPKFPAGLAGNLSGERASVSNDQSKTVKRERHAVRPPVEHQWSLSGMSQSTKPPQIFQHELIQNFSFNMFCKTPITKVRTYKDMRNVLMKRIFLSALHFRINSRYKSSNPPFLAIELDHSDSGREGCTVTTLTVTAEPRNWQNAIKVAVHEARRLKEFGVTKGELARYMDALLKDSEHLAAMIDNVPSVDNLDFIMESDALGHRVMDQIQGHESLIAVSETVTLSEVNSTGAQMLEFISEFGNPAAPLPAAIVACVPKKVHIDGKGETEFTIHPNEITDAIKEGLKEPIQAEPEVEVPKELVSSAQLEELRLVCEPSFIPLRKEVDTAKEYDKETGITLRRLSNGIPVNYKGPFSQMLKLCKRGGKEEVKGKLKKWRKTKRMMGSGATRITKNEARCGVMRLVVGGGRATENFDSRGAVVVGVRTLSEGGRLAQMMEEDDATNGPLYALHDFVELFCVNHLINCSLESTEEFICMEFRFTLRDNGMRAAFQLLHMVLEHSVWLEDAFDRAVHVYASHYRSVPKSLERSTAHKLMLAMLNGDERFVEPTPQSLQKLSLQSVRDAVMGQFFGENMEVSIVGDFTEQDIESCILDYLGTVTAKKSPVGGLLLNPIKFRPSPSDLQIQHIDFSGISAVIFCVVKVSMLKLSYDLI